MIRQQAVTFKNRTWDVAATLRLPEGFDASKKYAAIICAYPISSCREQTAGHVYGEQLASAGFVTLAFDASADASALGASGADAQYSQDPATRVEDFRCAIDWLVTQPFIDTARVGVLGVCGGGGYAANVAMIERRIKAVGTVVAVNYGCMMCDGYQSSDAASATLDARNQHCTAEAHGATPLGVGYTPYGKQNTGVKAGVNAIHRVQAINDDMNPFGQQAASPNPLPCSGLGPALGWDAFHLADVLLTQPLHVVLGSVPGDLGSFSDGHELYHRARSAQKSIQIVEGASHYELHDWSEATGKALEQLIPFYKKHLAA